MSINIPDHYAQQFATNVVLLSQQKGTRLTRTVTQGFYQGDQASPVDQIDSVEAQEVVTRFAPMGRVDPTLPRRWVFPKSFDLPQLIDKFDKLKIITDPESAYVTNAVWALGRKKDAQIINAFLAAAKTGQDGSGSTPFNTANEIGVNVGGTNSRLNVDKLLDARELAMANDLDLDEFPLFCAITAKDDKALLKEIEITSREFNRKDVPVLQDGKIQSFLGIHFIHTELVEKLNAGINKVNIPVWQMGGMHLGMWSEIRTSVSIRNDIQGEPFQIYVYGTFGGTRLDEERVFNIVSFR